MRIIHFAVLCAAAAWLAAGELPPPVTSGGKPLMEALKARQSGREFSPRKLPEQTLSNLLWAAWGVNRPEKGGRTAPSAMNRQEVDLYAVTAEGAFLYDAKKHALQAVAAGDLRALAGTQGFVKDAPLNLVLVADTAKSGDLTYAAISAGAISQNVYLYCASEGLSTVVRASVDRPALEKALRLRPEQKILVAQTVGFLK
ncbi:MAG: SagB/ThcOx family dehydrogenase [Acidobacteria bacterium]|nr:SagB/ThcOx family dehydrogenase [Acidobacteriota bacterium]